MADRLTMAPPWGQPLKSSRPFKPCSPTSASGTSSAISEVAQLRDELERARADLVDHAGQLAEAREQLRALSAPSVATWSERLQTSDSERVSVEVTRRTPSKPPQRAPWWRPWRRATS
jgi:hypothetical protein